MVVRAAEEAAGAAAGGKAPTASRPSAGVTPFLEHDHVLPPAVITAKAGTPWTARASGEMDPGLRRGDTAFDVGTEPTTPLAVIPAKAGTQASTRTSRALGPAHAPGLPPTH